MRTLGRLQLTQAVLYACGQPGKALLQLFEHLACVLVRASAHGGRIALGQLKQAHALCLDRRQQALLLQHIAHMRLRLANQPLLLADYSAGLLQLLRHRHPHPVDNVQNALFVHQQPAAEEDSPPFCQRIFKFVD
jgi:hypothetical protein